MIASVVPRGTKSRKVDLAHLKVVRALRTIRVPNVFQEAELYGAVASALRWHRVSFEREYVLGTRGRLDFLADGGVAIECKKGKPNGTSLLRQVSRYCTAPEVHSLVVVLPWSKHFRLPTNISGKPVTVLPLNRLWGVAI